MEDDAVIMTSGTEVPLENPVSSVPSPEYSIKDLYDLIKDVMGVSQVSPVVLKQITDFVIKDKMTYKEIARCIVWCDEVGMKDKLDKWNPIYGIGCIRNVREQANSYFAELAEEQKKKQREAQEAKVIAQTNIIFNIKQIKKPRRSPKHYDISEIDVGDFAKESTTDE